jgi:hypothetical protein
MGPTVKPGVPLNTKVSKLLPDHKQTSVTLLEASTPDKPTFRNLQFILCVSPNCQTAYPQTGFTPAIDKQKGVPGTLQNNDL